MLPKCDTGAKPERLGPPGSDRGILELCQIPACVTIAIGDLWERFQQARSGEMKRRLIRVWFVPEIFWVFAKESAYNFPVRSGRPRVNAWPLIKKD